MSRSSRRVGLGGLVASLVLVGLAVPAWAYFSVASTAATAAGRVATLGTPAVATSGIRSSSVTFTVTAPNSGPTPTGYRVARTSPNAVASVCTVTGTSGTCTDTAPVAGDTNTYSVYAVLAGTAWQSPVSATTSVVVPSADTAAPETTALQSPTANGAGWNKTDVVVALTATDATGVAGTWYTIDNSTPTTSSTAYTTPFTLTSTATVKFFSKDTAGNTEMAKSLVVQIDKVAPSAAVTSPTAGTVVGGTVTVSGTASDAGSGLASLVAQYQQGANAAVNLLGTVTFNGTSWSTSWSSAGLADGSYSLQVVATDVAGNATTSPAVAVTLRNTFTVIAPSTATAGTQFNLTVSTYPGYTGTKSISVSGLAVSPSGSTATVPTSAVFSNGTATVPVTAVKSGSQAITVTDTTLTSLVGTSGAINVNAGAPARLAWTNLTAVTVGTPCYFTCTATMGNGNGNGISSKVSVTDASGNIVSNLGGSGLSVTVESQAGAGGGLSTQTITIPATGPATSAGPSQSSGVWKYTDNGNTAYTRTFTASAGTYTAATVAVTK